MKLSKFKEKNIFCIEGNWGNNLKDKASIHAALEFLHCNANIKFIRKDCSSIEQFELLLNTSLQKAYKKYGIIYFAFHGSPNQLKIGNRKNIDLEHIAEILNGGAQDKIIHFGSCSTLKGLSGWDLKRFIKNTGALAISGYTTDIDFIESTVLDILYFKKCQKFNKVSLIHKEMLQYYGKLINELGFKMAYEK